MPVTLARTTPLLPLAVLPLALLAAAPASAATRDWPLRGFDRIDLAAAADVGVRVGPGFAVHAEGDQAGIDALEPSLRGGTLVLGWRKGTHNLHLRSELHVTVTMPRIAGATVSGAGRVRIDRVEAPSFTGDVAGAGQLILPVVRTRATVLGVSGTGSIDAAGLTGRLDARVSGVGSIDARGLAGRAGRLTVSGTGNVAARIDGPAQVAMSGLGNVTVLGNPRCQVSRTGLGSVECGG